MNKKTRPIYMLPLRDPPQIERYTQTKSKGMEKYISCKQKGEKSWDSSTYTDKIDFKTKAIVRDKERHYIMIKVKIQQENITLVDIYAPNIGASKYIKQILINIKGEIHRNTVTVRDFNTPLTSMGRSSTRRQQP